MPVTNTAGVLSITGTVQSSSDFSGVAGCTVSADGKKVILSGVKIENSGTFIIIPEEYEIIFDNTCTFPHLKNKSGSTLQLGTKRTINGISAYSKGSVITSNRVAAGSNPTFDMDSFGLLNSEANVTFKAYGGTINTPSSLAIVGSHAVKAVSGCTIDIEALTINNTCVLASNGNRLCALYFDGTTVITNLNITVAGILNPMEIRNDAGIVDAAFKLENSAINTDFQSNAKKSFVDVVFATNQNSYDIRPRQASGGLNFYDTYRNTDIGTASEIDAAANNRKGQGIFTQDVTVTTKTVTGSDVDAVLYLKDTVNSDAFITHSDPATIDFTQAFTYSATSASGQASFNVITGAYNKLVDSAPTKHYRSNSGTDADNFTIYAYEYGKSFLTLPVILKGNGGTIVSATFVQDLLITEQDKSVVDIYPITVSLSGNTWTITGDNTTLQTVTANQIYDLIASYMKDNFIGEDVRVNRSGNSLDFSALDVTLDYITLTGSIETTGSVTLQNGSSALSIIDSAADSFLSFSGISSWIVYGTAVDRDSNTNVLGSGNASQTYRFNYVPTTTYYLRLTTTAGETIFKEVTPTASGRTEVSLETTALLSSVNRALGYTEPKIYVNTSLAINGDGTSAFKYNNINDAINLYKQNNGFLEIVLTSSMVNPATISVNADNVIIRGTSQDSYVNLNGASLQGATISKVSILGNQNISNTVTYYENCAIRGNGAFVGKMENCGFYGDGINPLVIQFYNFVELIGCRSSNIFDTTFDFSNVAGAISHDWKGGQHKVDNITGSKIYTLYADRGECIINASCTGGLITVNDMIVTINNGTSTLNNLGTSEYKSDIIYDDTNELQQNQGNWITATGFATPANITASQVAIISEIQQSESDIISHTLSEAELHTALDNYTNKDDWKADVSNLSADVNIVQVNGVPVTSINDFKADISNLALEATVNALNNLSSADVTNAVPTTSQIAVAVEAALINDGDGQQLIDAILQVINSNLDLPALELAAIAQAVRTELTTELARIDMNISSITGIDETGFHSYLDSYSNKNAYKADISSLETKSQADIRQIQIIAENNETQNLISNLNNVSLAGIKNEVVNSLTEYDAPTKLELDVAINEIKGTGWTTETLKTIKESVDLAKDHAASSNIQTKRI